MLFLDRVIIPDIGLEDWIVEVGLASRFGMGGEGCFGLGWKHGVYYLHWVGSNY